ncbi:zinc finger protein 341-like isoform X2 [Copidosoma floridanum]|uniref:zinc finger protein 341-like isoform X2 n=1 Tax=Copidosoma floridanum TaxID=29053 RepID=UPI0006C9C107|nr:zinc finger protein 341-like isoform X2 [Copidosoma floridanum]
MSQSIFDALSGVSLDSSSVQSLLESQTLINEVEHSAFDQDEEDIFQCGKCKTQFNSLHMFVLHKREHTSTKLQEQTVDLSQYLVSNDSPIVQTDDNCQDATDYDDFDSSHELGDSIILQENDILFSMDGASYLTSDSSFSVPIILSTDDLESFDNTSIIAGTDDNLLNEEVSEMQALENDIKHNQSLDDDSNGQEAISLGSPKDVKPAEDIKKESQLGQIQNFKYKCSYCHKQFAKKFYWQQHERSHTGEKPYQCVVCGRPFAQKSNVKKHMSSHKVWPGTAIHSLPPEAPVDGSIERSYHCQFCKEIFDSYKALKNHLIVSHLTLKVYKCVQYGCGSMFAELDDFLEHTRSHKRSEYRCHVCGDTFNTLSDLGLHQYTHSVQKQKTTEKYYCCSVCKSSFSNLEALQHHTETTTHDYGCPHCGKSFLIERFLRRHLKTHTSFARFACEDCGKAFKTEQYLANHKLIHSDETPFHCPHCPARFKRKDRLGRHMLIHDLSKRLKCPFRSYLGCMSEFSRPDKLKRHLLTHNNVKRFSCNICNRHFHRAQALKHHEINKHSLKCDVCSHIFRSKEQLVSHNCEQSSELRKHTSSQLPKKASGTFKPRRPTPKRQLSSKTSSTTSSPCDKEKIKAEDVQMQNIVTVETLIVNHQENDFDAKIENLDLDLDLSSEIPLRIDPLRIDPLRSD